jgi:hypothetical protein
MLSVEYFELFLFAWIIWRMPSFDLENPESNLATVILPMVLLLEIL